MLIIEDKSINIKMADFLISWLCPAPRPLNLDMILDIRKNVFMESRKRETLINQRFYI